jgi:hypothetical protein
MKQHPGISIHHIAIGGGTMGAVFAIGTCLIFFFGIVEVRWFLLLSLPFAIGVAVLLHVFYKRRPVERTGPTKPLALSLIERQ